MASLRAFTVIASIDRHGRRLLPDPLVVEGHHDAPGEAGTYPQRTVAVHVWARDRADAAQQLRRARPQRQMPPAAVALRRVLTILTALLRGAHRARRPTPVRTADGIRRLPDAMEGPR